MSYSKQIVNTMYKLDQLLSDGFCHDVDQVAELIASLPTELAERVAKLFLFDRGWLFVGADYASLNLATLFREERMKTL